MNQIRNGRYEKYKTKKLQDGYMRINKWCPVEYKNAINCLIDILSCHKEDPDSTKEFHTFIDALLYVQARFESEYEVKDLK